MGPGSGAFRAGGRALGVAREGASRQAATVAAESPASRAKAPLLTGPRVSRAGRDLSADPTGARTQAQMALGVFVGTCLC